MLVATSQHWQDGKEFALVRQSSIVTPLLLQVSDTLCVNHQKGTPFLFLSSRIVAVNRSFRAVHGDDLLVRALRPHPAIFTVSAAAPLLWSKPPAIDRITQALRQFAEHPLFYPELYKGKDICWLRLHRSPAKAALPRKTIKLPA